MNKLLLGLLLTFLPFLAFAGEQQLKETTIDVSVLKALVNKDTVLVNPGSKKTKVIIVELADYNCPYCKKRTDELHALVEEFPHAKLITPVFPGLGEERSIEADKGALAARNQGKFAEMHKALMHSQMKLTAVNVRDIAAKQGLDMKQYDIDIAGDALRHEALDNADYIANNVHPEMYPMLIMVGSSLPASGQVNVAEWYGPLDHNRIKAEVKKLQQA